MNFDPEFMELLKSELLMPGTMPQTFFREPVLNTLVNLAGGGFAAWCDEHQEAYLVYLDYPQEVLGQLHDCDENEDDCDWDEEEEYCRVAEAQHDSQHQLRETQLWVGTSLIAPNIHADNAYEINTRSTNPTAAYNDHYNNCRRNDVFMTASERINWVTRYAANLGGAARVFAEHQPESLTRLHGGTNFPQPYISTFGQRLDRDPDNYYNPSATFNSRHLVTTDNTEPGTVPFGCMSVMDDFYTNRLIYNYYCYMCNNNYSSTSRPGYKDIPNQWPGTIICLGCVKRRTFFCGRNNNHYTILGRLFGQSAPADHTSLRARDDTTDSLVQRYCLHCANEFLPEQAGRRCPRCSIVCTAESFQQRVYSDIQSNYRPGREDEGDPRNRWCTSCVLMHYALCRTCNTWCDTGYIRTVGNTRICSNCCGNRYIRNYSYKPTPKFFPEPKPKQLYMGLEIEVCCMPGVKPAIWLEQHGLRFDKNFFYIKSDSSLVNGMEIVTHPFTPEWGMENFPATLFDTLVSEQVLFPTHNSSGQHIHVSKDAFTTAHMWKFCMTHWKYKDLIQVIGGRPYDFNSGTFQPGRNQGLNILISTLGLNPLSLSRDENGQALTFAAKELAQKKSWNGVRTVALNFQNEATVELRYPRGTAVGNEILKNIEWVQCVYEFSKMLDVADLADDVLGEPGYLLGFIETNQNRWPHLNDWVTNRIPRPKYFKKNIKSKGDK